LTAGAGHLWGRLVEASKPQAPLLPQACPLILP